VPSGTSFLFLIVFHRLGILPNPGEVVEFQSYFVCLVNPLQGNTTIGDSITTILKPLRGREHYGFTIILEF